MARERNLFQRILGLNKEERAAAPVFPTQAHTGWLSTIVSDTTLNSGADTLTLSAVYACVSKISDTIASMAVTVEKVDKDGIRRPMPSHPVSRMMAVEPNPMMGAYEFWQMIVSDALLYGIGTALLLDDEIYWLPATEVQSKVEPDGSRWYTYTGSPSPIPQEQILEVKAFRGKNPTNIQIQNLNTAKSIQNFGSTFFENGGMLGGILTTKEPLTIEQMREASERWKQEFMGKKNAHKVAILGGGFAYQPLSVPLEQLQFVEVKKHTAEEIARFFQVPPAIIGMEGNSSYDNYEQQTLQFFQGTILPWVRRIELEIERKVLRKDNSLSCRFDIDSMLRADSTSRSSYYHSLLSDGVLSINEVRSKEGLAPVQGGDNHHIQLNQIPLSSMSDYASAVVSKGDEQGSDGVDNQAKMNLEEDENNQ
jgi:HK97 family phage portal protein